MSATPVTPVGTSALLPYNFSFGNLLLRCTAQSDGSLLFEAADVSSSPATPFFTTLGNTFPRTNALSFPALTVDNNNLIWLAYTARITIYYNLYYLRLASFEVAPDFETGNYIMTNLLMYSSSSHNQDYEGRSELFGSSIAYFNNSLYIAYAGSDQNGTINVGPVSISSSASGNSWTLSTQSANCGSTRTPSLSALNGTLFLAFTSFGNNLFYTLSFDGVNWQSNQSTYFNAADTTYSRPTQIVYLDQQTPPQAHALYTWRGTDSNNGVNYYKILGGPGGNVTKKTLGNSASYGIAAARSGNNTYISFTGPNNNYHCFAL